MVPLRRTSMVKVKIEVTNVRDERQDYWVVTRCSVHVDEDAAPKQSVRSFEIINHLQSGEQYGSKDAAVEEMKRRARKLLQEKGRTETDEQVKWIIP
jgi:hypothetical protein